jgi:Ribonuclease HII
MANLPENVRHLCGIDEAGRGPVFGPMVISMVCGDIDKIMKSGARDSKEMSQAARERAYEKIMEEAESVKFEIINSSEINTLMESMTLNEIEGKYVLKLIKNTTYPVIVDSFDVHSERCSKNLSEMSGKFVICRHKADRDYSIVSAASVVAR